MVKVGDIVHAEYNNGEVVDGEVVKVREFTVESSNEAVTLGVPRFINRTLVTVKCKQGYRSIYLDCCVEFLILQAL